MLLGYSINELRNRGAGITAAEITQQPQLWMETCNIIKNLSEEINNFLISIERENIQRIILTGAGTSSFIGETISPYLCSKLGRTVEVIATTDIVTNPENYLFKDVSTLLISYARSGNSPESVGAVDLAEKIVKNLYQIIITCNPKGKLADKAISNNKNLLIFMPEASNDQGFAMTGSFTCMMLASILIFDMKNLDERIENIKYVSETGKNILSQKLNILGELAEIDYDRIVFLGSSILKGIAREASLKVLELTRGEVAAFYDSPLGFRHGPKSIINDNTLIFLFLSDDTYTRKYEVDLLKEMRNDGGGKIVIALSSSYDEDVEGVTDYLIPMDNYTGEYPNDMFLAFNYIMAAQILAFYRSLNLGVKPDDPSPGGLVNRVVKGVNIYELDKIN